MSKHHYAVRGAILGSLFGLPCGFLMMVADELAGPTSLAMEWVGGAIGLLVGSLFGAAIGAVLGAFCDEINRKREQK